MLIFAHRGLKLQYQENSILAYKKAIENGFSIECDVRMTADKQVIMSHDPNLSVLTRNIKPINAMTLTELRKLTLPEPIPTFEEVCKLLKTTLNNGQQAAIHLKIDEQTTLMLKTLAHFLLDYDLFDQSFIFDGTLETCRALKKLDQRIRTAVSIGEQNYSPTIYKWEQVQPHLNLFNHVWWDEWKQAGSVYNETLAQKIKANSKQIYAISPELHANHNHPQAHNGYEDVWNHFISWNIDGVCTAYPEKLRELFKKLKMAD